MVIRRSLKKVFFDDYNIPPSATIATKTGARTPMSRRAALSEVSESGFTDCSSRLVIGQATQAAAIAMPKVDSGMPMLEVT